MSDYKEKICPSLRYFAELVGTINCISLHTVKLFNNTIEDLNSPAKLANALKNRGGAYVNAINLSGDKVLTADDVNKIFIRTALGGNITLPSPTSVPSGSTLVFVSPDVAAGTPSHTIQTPDSTPILVQGTGLNTLPFVDGSYWILVCLGTRWVVQNNSILGGTIHISGAEMNVWYTNESAQPKYVFIQADKGTASGVVDIHLRRPGIDGSVFVNNAGNAVKLNLFCIVPPGWQYLFKSGGSASNVQTYSIHF